MIAVIFLSDDDLEEIFRSICTCALDRKSLEAEHTNDAEPSTARSIERRFVRLIPTPEILMNMKLRPPALVEVATLLDDCGIRTSMDGIPQLAESLKKGQTNPIFYTRSRRVLAGHRRVAAAKSAGITHLLGIEVDDDLTPAKIIELQALDHFHSEAISDYDKALAVKTIKDANALSGRQLAERLDIDVSMPTKLLSLFECIAAVQEAAKAGKIGVTKWYAISRSADQEEALRLALNGATREEVTRKTRKGGPAPAVRAARIKCPLPSGQMVMVSGGEISLEEFVEAMAEASKLAKAALSKGLTAKSAQSVWRDIAAV